MELVRHGRISSVDGLRPFATLIRIDHKNNIMRSHGISVGIVSHYEIKSPHPARGDEQGREWGIWAGGGG